MAVALTNHQYAPAIIEASGLTGEKYPEKPVKRKGPDPEKEKLRIANMRAQARRLEILSHLRRYQIRRKIMLNAPLRPRADKIFVTTGTAINLKSRGNFRNAST